MSATAATMKIPLPSTVLLLAIYVVIARAQNANEGNPAKLQNNIPPGQLNTGRGTETDQQKADRMGKRVPAIDPFEDPDPNIGPFDQAGGPLGDPLHKAKCLNEAYTIATINTTDLYYDYVKIFEWGFSNNMGAPLQSRSIDNNHVTNNRFPSMFLRMCFHDNSIDSAFPSFNDYIKANMGDKGKWNGKHRYLDTSGADASVLLCSEERYHPNQNYDQTASRILYALQSNATGITTGTGAISMVDKYGLSYSDLLQNGGVAAAIYLTKAEEILSTVFTPKFGRKDACHLPPGLAVVGNEKPKNLFQKRVDLANKKAIFGQSNRFSLCGPTENLPGILMEADEIRNWFYDRGMNECTWLALMWTHTVMDNMAMTCPLRKLPTIATADDMDELDRYKSTGRIYFKENDTLDYHSFFLNRGEHVPTPPDQVIDFEQANCKWKLSNGRRYHWPMTRPDCALGLTAVEARENVTEDLGPLKNAIKSYGHGNLTTSTKVRALLYALSILSGDGSVVPPVLPGCNFTEIEKPQLFGAYGTLV